MCFFRFGLFLKTKTRLGYLKRKAAFMERLIRRLKILKSTGKQKILFVNAGIQVEVESVTNGILPKIFTSENRDCGEFRFVSEKSLTFGKTVAKSEGSFGPV